MLGLESGFAIHVGAACLGVSGLVAASDELLRVLQVGGAAYLAHLGIRLLRRGDPDARLDAARREPTAASPASTSPASSSTC